MAEVKNLFIKSKMNKDLDDRLLPSGEYRDGQNVMISRSEGADVGSLENILGNWNIQDFAVDPNNASLNAILNPTGFNVGGAGTIGPTIVLATGGSGTGLEVSISVDTSGNISITGTLNEGSGYQPGDIVSFDPAAVDPAWVGAPVFFSDAMREDTIGPDFSVIGKYEDELTNRIYVFLTNYTDCSTSRLNNYSLDTAGSIPYITPGIVSIIACFDLNSMQYIQLVRGRFLNFSKNSPIIGVNVLENLLFWTDNRNQPRKINIQKALANPFNSPTPYYTEEQQISVAKYYPYIAPRLWTEEDIGGILYPQCQMKDKSDEFLPRNIGQPVGAEYNNPTYDATFPGDPNFLKDKFARFSYRFKFDDNEYSIIAPFSQIAFIPEQDGFFMATLDNLGGLLFTNEQQAYRSTIVDFMENKVDSVKIFIDLPCPLNELADKFKVKEIDILYKESSSIATKVVETLQISSNTPVVDTFISYEYLSTVPITTLPEIQTTRVYDQVPLRALAQEVIGNRVVYGNFQTINSYPNYLDYKVGVSEKAVTSVGAAPLPETTRVEYPNHTLKQSRNYEVGIVLVDRYGRQSPVITTDPDLDVLSTVGGVDFKGSTIFYPYYNETGSAINPQPDILDWCGDSLKMLFNNSIGVPGVRDAGLYTERNPLGWYSYKIVVKQTEQEYYNVYLPGMLDGYPFYNTDQLPDSTAHIVLINDNINKVPRDLREVGPTQQTFSSSIRLSGRVENVATPQISPTTPPYNRQYYPGARQDQVSSIGTMEDLKLGTAKYFNLSTADVSQTFPIAGDYIFVKEFNEDITDRMSVTPLNTPIGLLPAEFPPEVYLEEYSENPAFDSTAATGITACRGRFKLYDAATGAPYALPYQVDADDTLRITNPYFYSSSGNPLIGRVATENPIGSKMESSTFVVPEFSVYETEAVESNLDIFWETTTSGIISELNDAIAVGGDIEGFDEWSYTQLESYPIGNNVLLTDVQAVDSLNVVVPLTSLTLDNVTSYNAGGTAINRTADFILVEPVPGQWNIDTTVLFYFGNTAATAQTENYEFTFTAIPTNPLLNTKTLTYPGGLSNVKPILTAPSFTSSAGGGILGQIYTDGNGANINDSRKNQNLVFSIIEQLDTANNGVVNYFSLSTTSSLLQNNVNFIPSTPPGVYEITYQLADCNGNGLIDIASATITITQPLLTGGFTPGFAQSFTLWQGGLSFWGSTSGMINPSVSNLDWVGRNNGPISTSVDSFSYNSIGYQTHRSIPVNLTLPIVGATSTSTDTGPRYRGWLPSTGAGALDNNACGVGASSAQKYTGYYTIPQIKSENKNHSGIGLTGGTVMFTITQEYDLSTKNKGIGTFQNVIIQHRTNSSSAWSEAVDIDGEPFRGMIWDFVGNYDWWGYKSILYSSAAPTNKNVRFNRQDCITEPSGIFGISNSCAATNDGLGTNSDCGVYQDTPFDNALCTTGSRFSFPPCTYSSVWKKSNRTGAELKGTMNLRNYSSCNTCWPQFVGVAVAERTFVVDAPGEYRIFFDNLSQSLAVSDTSFDRQSQAPSQASEDISSVLNVKDFYDLDPAGPWFEYRVQNIGYTYAASAFEYSMQGTEWPSDWHGVNNGNNWPNVGAPLLLYSQEGSFRYVNKFYERTGTGVPADPYVYTEWNPSSTGWYAYTEPTAAPVGAAFPIGAERAFGPRKGVAPYNSGCWPIWAMKINLSGTRIGGPAPCAYESVQAGQTPPWY